MAEANLTNSSSDRFDEDPEKKGAFVFFACLFWFGAAADGFMIFIIRKTPTLKSYTGYLLTSQLLSDVGLHIVSFLMILPRIVDKADMFGETGLTILAQFARGFRGITSHTLSVTSLNLYFAICHSTAYRKWMSKRKVNVFVPVCWISNILLCILSLAVTETRKSLYIRHGEALLPNYTIHSSWAWVVVVINVYVVPALITAFCFLKIRKYSHKIQPITNANFHYRDKLQLSQIITGISVCYIGMWSLLHLFRALQARFEVNYEERGVFRNLSLTAYLVNLAYDSLKVVVFIRIYKPVRDTMLQMFRRSPAVAMETRETNF